VSDIVERLRAAYNGHPHAKGPWPHRLLHDAIAEIERLRGLERAVLAAVARNEAPIAKRES